MGVDVSGIGRAADPGEDLLPLREVPVPERRPGNERVGHPRAAAQDPVVLAEEHLRVFGVGEGAEPGIPLKAGRRPLPDRSVDVLEVSPPTVWTDFSHSASVSNRLPAQRAYASAW